MGYKRFFRTAVMGAFILIFLILFTPLAGEWMYVPAVSDGTGNLVNISVVGVPGSNRVFIDVLSPVGIDTQQSIKVARDVAYQHAPFSPPHDLFVTIQTSSERSVAGPSGGAAFTVLTYAALTGKTLRKDATITGTIMEDGRIGEVGGVYEKARAAHEGGLRAILVPFPQPLQEELRLSRLPIEVYYVENVSEAFAFFFEGAMLPRKSVLDKPNLRPVPPPAEVHVSAPFRVVAEKVLSLVSQELSRIDGIEPSVQEYFDAKRLHAQSLIAHGFFYTAANDAFVTYVDAALYRASATPHVSLSEEINETRLCLERVKSKRPQVKKETFDWIAGGDVRYVRAVAQMEKLPTNVTSSNVFSVLSDVLYAKAWCLSAELIYEHTPSGTHDVDERRLEKRAKREVEHVLSYRPLGEDIGWRVTVVNRAYEMGLYGAVLHEGAYIRSLFEQTNETPLRDIWPELYALHSNYFEGTSREHMRRLALFIQRADNDAAFVFDSNIDEIARSLHTDTSTNTSSPPLPPTEPSVVSFGAVFVLGILVGALCMFLFFRYTHQRTELRR